MAWAVDLGVQITVQTKEQKKFQNPTIKMISDLNYNCQLPSQETEKTIRPIENVALTMKGLQDRKHTTVGWDDCGKIGKIIH